MHNYTLQCFGTVAALTNDKGASLGAYPLVTGSYVGLLAIPNCIKSLNLSRMAFALEPSEERQYTDTGPRPNLVLTHGAFRCSLVTFQAQALRDGSGIVDDGHGTGIWLDPPKPVPGAELLKLVPAGLKKGAKYNDHERCAVAGSVYITKKQEHGPVIRGVLESVEYWGGVNKLQGLIKPPSESYKHGLVSISLDGTAMQFGYDTAKLIEKLSKKATFGIGSCEMQFAKPSKQGPVMSACIVAYLDGYNYIFTPMSGENPYITLTLETVMEQVA